MLNMKLKRYIIELATRKLEACPDFVKVYGRGFVTRQLRNNIQEVYSNVEIDGESGEYNFINQKLTICASGENKERLSVEDIENNIDLQEVALHEAIHAIFRKSEEECRKLGIESGTGTLEVKEDGSELGRGINEGITVWLCKKAGFNSKKYSLLTNSIHQLELARGTKNIMKMAKGDISNNVTKCLGMNKEECEHFLALGDQQCTLGENYIFFRGIAIFKGTAIDDKEKKKLFAKLREDSRLKLCLESKEFAEASNEDEQLTVLFKFAYEQAKALEPQRRDTALQMDSIIFDKYFKQEFDQIKKRGRITKKEIKRFEKLSKYMQNVSGSPNESEYSSIQFQKDFQILKQKYAQKIYKKAEATFYKGKLTGKALEKYVNATSIVGAGAINVLLNRVAAKISFECQDDVFELLLRLQKDGRLSEADRYSIKKAKSREKEVTFFNKDSHIEETVYGRKASNVRLLDGEADKYLNFTLEIDENFNAIVTSFLRLKERVYEENARARMQIIDRAIIVDDEDIYIICESGIRKAESVQEIELNPEPIEAGKRLPVQRKVSLIDRIRNKIFYGGSETQNASYYRGRQRNEFRRNLRDMSNYAVANTKESLTQVYTKDLKKDDNAR